MPGKQRTADNRKTKHAKDAAERQKNTVPSDSSEMTEQRTAAASRRKMQDSRSYSLHPDTRNKPVSHPIPTYLLPRHRKTSNTPTTQYETVPPEDKTGTTETDTDEEKLHRQASPNMTYVPSSTNSTQQKAHLQTTCKPGWRIYYTSKTEERNGHPTTMTTQAEGAEEFRRRNMALRQTQSADLANKIRQADPVHMIRHFRPADLATRIRQEDHFRHGAEIRHPRINGTPHCRNHRGTPASIFRQQEEDTADPPAEGHVALRRNHVDNRHAPALPQETQILPTPPTLPTPAEQKTDATTTTDNAETPTTTKSMVRQLHRHAHYQDMSRSDRATEPDPPPEIRTQFRRHQWFNHNQCTYTPPPT